VKPEPARELLATAVADLASARRHLDYSFEQVVHLPGILDGVGEDELESIEAFCSRFARTVDLVVSKVLRSLDRAELHPEGTLLDVVNRAEKRGLLAHAGDLREMKDVRNIITHDYAGARMAEVFVYCREQKPILDSLCEAIRVYATRICQSGS